MKTVGIRELKNRLSAYIRQVREGENVLVTDRGVVVAELGPPGWGASPGGNALSALAAKGDVRLGSGNQPGLYPALFPLLPERRGQDLLDEDRGAR